MWQHQKFDVVWALKSFRMIWNDLLSLPRVSTALRCRKSSRTLLSVFFCHACTVVIVFHPWQKQNEEERVEHASPSAVLLRCTYAAWLLRLGNHQWQGGKNIRYFASSVCSCQRCTSLHVSRARDEPNMKHEAEDTPQFDTAGAHCGVMLTLLNLFTVISDIKGQAVNSRWSFCRPVSLFLDWFNSVQVESSDPSLFSDWREFPHS